MPSRELNVLDAYHHPVDSWRCARQHLHDIALALNNNYTAKSDRHHWMAFSAYLVPLIRLAAIIFANIMKPGVLDDMASSFYRTPHPARGFNLLQLGALLGKLVSRVGMKCFTFNLLLNSGFSCTHCTLRPPTSLEMMAPVSLACTST